MKSLTRSLLAVPMCVVFLVLTFVNVATAQATDSDNQCTDSIEYCGGFINSVCPFLEDMCDDAALEGCKERLYATPGVCCGCSDCVEPCSWLICDYDFACGGQPLYENTTPDNTPPLSGCDYDLDSDPCGVRDWAASRIEYEEVRRDTERFTQEDRFPVFIAPPCETETCLIDPYGPPRH